jgi:hypothetical protein
MCNAIFSQHASWNTGLLTPHTEAHGTEVGLPEAGFPEAVAQETELQALEVYMDDAITEPNLQQHEEGEIDGWNDPETVAYFEELFGKDPEPAITTAATDATTCSVASSDTGIMDEDNSRAMVPETDNEADDATTCSDVSLDQASRDTVDYNEQDDAESMSPQTSDGGELDFDLDVSYTKDNSYSLSKVLFIRRR